MSDGRYKRLSQYSKVFRYCHSRLAKCHVMTRQEHEALFYVETRAMVAVFNNASGIKSDLQDVLRSIET